MASITIDRRDGLNSAAAIKGPCRVATTANITLSGLQTIDGVALAEGDRVLVKNQTDARDNGIRIASTGNWERSADFRNSRDIVTGTQVYITHGTVSAERWYGVTAANPISVGTTNMTFAVSDNLTAIEAVAAEVDAIAAAFPAITANTMLVDNAAGDARETKTFAEVNEKLGTFETEAAASAATIDATIKRVRLEGNAALGDGLGGLYVDTDNGATDTFTSNGGTRTWYRVADVGVDRLAAGVSSLINGALQKSGGTMSGVLTWDNGTDPTIPTMTAAGAFDLNIGGTSHFKIWPDLDGDGDYDADIWSKDNMYVVAESAIHLRPGYVKGQPEAGRLRISAENNTNYIQSGRNFSGTTENDLVISKYGSSFAWTMYDVSQNGYAGFGYSLGNTVPARLSAKDGSATVGYFENTSTAIARIAFKGSTTAGTTSVTVGASGEDLVLRGAGSDIVRVNTTGVYPMTDNNRILGSSSFRWSTVYAGTGTINTSDATTKRWLGPIPEAVRRAMMRVANGVGHFQFLDAIAAKGDGARKHLGVTAQDVIAAFEAEGLDPWEWAPICKDPVFTTVVKTRTVTREVLKMVERTRIVRKKLMETVAVPVERVEILDGLPVLVATTKDELRPVVDMLPLHDEQGNIVTKTTADGSSEPVLVAVPRTYEAEETYIEEVTDTEEFDEEYEVTEETGKTILGVRHDELMWGIVATMLSWQQKWTDLPLKTL